MLTREENELLCRVGPGTPMGEVMRRYWVPVLCSRELEPDGPPLQVKLLGERLVAFRDTSGRVGVLEEFCPHRGVSLWLGRNEENGLRCVYHGWKFDAEGACVDQMNEPESFAHKIHVSAYPTIELGDIVWAYMGPPERRPPEPRFEFTAVPATHRTVTRVWEECNWLQAVEGGIDTSHAPIMHRALKLNASQPGIAPSTPFVRGKAPTLDVETTDYGYRYAGVRPLGDEGQYVRAYHFIMPFTQIRPSQFTGTNRTPEDYRPTASGHFWVPMDDDNCMVWNWHYSFGETPLSAGELEGRGGGNSAEDVDPSNNNRKLRNRENNWLIDRSAQKSETFTGILGINTQDHAVQESMGPIVDRSREHLGPADKAVIAARQLLLKAIQVVEDGGDPRGANASYYRLRAIERILPPDEQWWPAMREEFDPEAVMAG
jgi:phenylpropionate dioxygenase-like ring-hydroxylating dioxygenase large terminal subunit